jgi:glycosyltransferase involved in cell wall biosynthesis
MSLMVSVLMTAYNREKYIADAIQSVLNQTYHKFELIIVDDCSTDETISCINHYAQRDERIKLYENDKKLGQFANRNKAASLAKGDLLMYVDSDDTIQSDSISFAVDKFNNNPTVGFIMIYYGDRFSDETILSPEECIPKHFFDHNFLVVGPGASVIRTELFKKINGFKDIFGPASDMYYNLLVASSTHVLLHKYKYLNYRIHDGQELNNPFAYLYQGYLYLQYALSQSFLPMNESQIKFLRKKNKRRFLLNLIRYLLKTGQFQKIVKAVKITNFSSRDLFTAIFQW